MKWLKKKWWVIGLALTMLLFLAILPGFKYGTTVSSKIDNRLHIVTNGMGVKKE